MHRIRLLSYRSLGTLMSYSDHSADYTNQRLALSFSRRGLFSILGIALSPIHKY